MLGATRAGALTGVGGQEVTIERAESDDELAEFWLFANEVYAQRAAHWRTTANDVSPLLKGEGPGAAGRTTSALVARSGGRVIARAAALVDQHYIDRWDEPLGHVVLFEALPGTTEGVRALMDEASSWLRGQGLEAARAGWGGPGLDWPFTVDAYELLPPPVMRQNPAYYHSLLAEARFVAEKGMVDYKIEVTSDSGRALAADATSRRSFRLPGHELRRSRQIAPGRGLRYDMGNGICPSLGY